MQSCSLWKEGDAYAGWDYVYPFADRRKPFLGWYDEGNPEVADWEIKWQVEHGIDFEQYCWYRPNDAINHPIKDGVLEQGIRDGLFNARYSGLKKFTIMYTNQGAGDTNPDDWQNHIIPYWIEYFFKDPRYLKIDGKPVLAIYYPDNFLRDFGGVEGARRAIERLREDCVQAGFPGVIVLMELRNANRDVMQKMKAMGIDYCYAYTWGTARREPPAPGERGPARCRGGGGLPHVAQHLRGLADVALGRHPGSGQRLGLGVRLSGSGPMGQGRVHAHAAAGLAGTAGADAGQLERVRRGAFPDAIEPGRVRLRRRPARRLHPRRPALRPRARRATEAAVHRAVSAGITALSPKGTAMKRITAQCLVLRLVLSGLILPAVLLTVLALVFTDLRRDRRETFAHRVRRQFSSQRPSPRGTRQRWISRPPKVKLSACGP